VRAPKGRIVPQLAITMDWAATFLDAAGAAPHPDYPLDGVSLSKEHSGRELYWRMKFRDQKAMRSGQWKWLSIEGNEFLFDLSRDQRERANMKQSHPVKFNELKSRYTAWEAAMPPIPDDAKASFIGGPRDLAQPS
jgi:arylsulfatase A-like enzyme